MACDRAHTRQYLFRRAIVARAKVIMMIYIIRYIIELPLKHQFYKFGNMLGFFSIQLSLFLSLLFSYQYSIITRHKIIKRCFGVR